ncbi:uncharacterized protein [Argopecten irradians]|uniref:uncharacterized protein n=1 Tax=Argopecten irradians TaxID=31199 RepID=UPI0037111137
MAASMPTTPRTPHRVYSLSNVCCLCGFSFIVKETCNDGSTRVKKLYKLKLKFTEERANVMRKVIDLPSRADGVCVKCFSKVEKVLKYRAEIHDIITKFEETRKRFQAKTPGSSARKRKLGSPQMSGSKDIHIKVSSEAMPDTKLKAILPKPKGQEEITARKSLFSDESTTTKEAVKHQHKDIGVCPISSLLKNTDDLKMRTIPSSSQRPDIPGQSEVEKLCVGDVTVLA